MAVSFDDRIVVPRGVVTRVVGRSTVLLNSQSGRYFTLDDVGGRAWTQLTTSPSIRAALDCLMTEFAADADQLAADLQNLIDDLSTRGLIEVQRA
jgi:hypothetical protein